MCVHVLCCCFSGFSLDFQFNFLSTSRTRFVRINPSFKYLLRRFIETNVENSSRQVTYVLSVASEVESPRLKMDSAVESKRSAEDLTEPITTRNAEQLILPADTIPAFR